VTLNLAEMSIVKSRPSVPHGANLVLSCHQRHASLVWHATWHGRGQRQWWTPF